MSQDLDMQQLFGLAVSVLMVSYLAGVVAHEAGHAVAAKLLGLDLRLVSLGSGPALVRARLGGVRYVFRGVPTAGYVAIAARPGMPRWQYPAMVAAGPGVNAALVLAAATVYAARPDLDPLVLPFAAAQILILLGSLTPLNLRARRRSFRASDGQQLWHLLVNKPPDIFGANYAAVARLLVGTDRPLPAPSDSAPELIYQLFRTDQITEPWAAKEAFAAVRGLLGPWRLNAVERALALDFLVSSTLLFGWMGESETDLQAWSREACALAPGAATTLSRAGVLAVTGEGAQAVALLEPLRDTLEIALFRFRCELHLAQGYAAQCRLEPASEALARARQIALADGSRGVVAMAILARAQRWPPLAGTGLPGTAGPARELSMQPGL